MEKISKRLEILVNQKVFGEGEFIRVHSDTKTDTAAQYASELRFFSIEMSNGSTIHRIPIVTKIQPEGEGCRQLQDSDNQFWSEVTMFSKILPFLRADKLGVVPKYFYGEATKGLDPDMDLVILEDLSKEGYVTASDNCLDLPHIRLAMKKLGEFHGLSYRAKKSQYNDLMVLGKSLLVKKFIPDFNALLGPNFERGFKRLINHRRTDCVDLLQSVMEWILKVGVDETWKSLLVPTEPYAVIVHGDFNRNNVLFKYDEGKVCSIKFLDFQTALYSDPAVDLSFFLYLNSSQTMRNEHWTDFLNSYWDGVTSVEPNPGFTFDNFMENFARKAIYGYLPCSFFLPITLVGKDEDVPIQEFLLWDFDKKINHMITTGGDKATDAVADIVEDLLDRGYLESFSKHVH